MSENISYYRVPQMPFSKKRGGCRGGGRPTGPTNLKDMTPDEYSNYKRINDPRTKGKEDTSLPRAR